MAAWVEPTTTTGINAVSVDDVTVIAGDWYRYRVAASDDDALLTAYTDWVQAQAVEPPPPPPDSVLSFKAGGERRSLRVRVNGQSVEI